MHLNPQHPNILADMQAVANGQDLATRHKGEGGWYYSAKRHLIPRKTYPYASERQVKRQQQQHIYRETNLLLANSKKAETQG